MDILVIVVLVVFAILGAPLFAIFGAAAMLLFSERGTITSVAVDVFSERFADSPTLVTLPLFTFAGYLMAESGTPKRLVRVSQALFGWLPGGLAVVCLLASAFFTTFTGGSGITIVAVGGLLFPAMIQQKYQEKFSLGLVTTGGSLGLLFPPSIPIVLYAVVAGILIDDLFLAGIVPGVVTVVIIAAYAMIFGERDRAPNPERLKGFLQFLRFFGVLSVVGTAQIAAVAALSRAIYGEAGKLLSLGLVALAIQTFIIVVSYLVATLTTKGETRAALLETAWELLLPFVLIAGLATGSLRIHEAAALTALYVVVVEVFVYGDIKIKTDLPRVIRESTTMLGAILAILSTALGFTGYLIQARVPERLVEWMEVFITSDIMFLLALNIFLLVVGMLMDIFSAIVVVVPLIVPIARHFGIDPYHLGIVFLLNLEIGYLTPPVGLNLFISSFRFQKPVTQLYRAVLPFIGLLLIALAITTYVPFLSTWLPSAVGGDDADINEEVRDTGDDGGGEGLDDLGGGESLDDLGGETLDDLGRETLDDLGGETLDDLGGETLDDLGGETLDDLEPAPAEEPSEGETLDDL